MSRVVVFGANGFVGSSIASRLRRRGLETRTFGREDFDFSSKSYRAEFIKIIDPSDSIVFSSARVPVRTVEDYFYNSNILSNFVASLEGVEFDYLLNISSDAVYPDLKSPINEQTPPSPTTLHGLMHLNRECILNNVFERVGHLRPTLIYGPGDPHRGYGPNLFLQTAIESKLIHIFGEGEERRDHIYIDDVADFADIMLKEKIQGPINAVTGLIESFYFIASKIKELLPETEISFGPRKGPMPHNGYREFGESQIASCLSSQPLNLELGIKKYVELEVFRERN